MIDVFAGERVYFDTTVFCEAFEGTSEKASPLKAIFEAGKRRPGRIVTSELTLAELAAGEMWLQYSRFYLNLIVFNRLIRLIHVSRTILLDTGDYRRALKQTHHRMKLPDGIHAVTAVQSGCRYLVTSDKRFHAPRPLERITSDPAGLHFVFKTLDA